MIFFFVASVPLHTPTGHDQANRGCKGQPIRFQNQSKKETQITANRRNPNAKLDRGS
jgi:hypothetical protein